MRRAPSYNRFFISLSVAIVLVATLFFLEWLGSEQPQKVVEIEVQPGISADANGASGKD